jgi:multicomponent Na+:H+ antiporter subunit E
MKLFAINLLLALAWAALIGELTLTTFLSGFVIAYLIMCLVFLKASNNRSEVRHYLIRFPNIIRFFFFYIAEILKSNIQVAYDILTPSFHMRPGVIALPIEAKTDAEITVLANLISMTPGTLSLDVSKDRKTLFVHAMFIDDPEVLKRQIKDQLERRVLEIMR